MLLEYPKPRLWSKEEYYQAAELGWFDGQRVELIEGEVVEMPLQKEPHSATIVLVQRALGRIFPDAEYFVRVQLPLDLGLISQPEPDVAIARGDPRDLSRDVANVVLVVEVSGPTLEFDRVKKGSLYASRGVADYWIVNLRERHVEVLRNPVPDASKPPGFFYADQHFHTAGGTIAPLALPNARVRVDDLLL